MERHITPSDGRVLRARREELGWSRRQLGERAGVSADFVQTVENAGRTIHGQRAPQAVTPKVTQLVEALGFDSDSYTADGVLAPRRHAEQTPVEAALVADTRLDPLDRDILLRLYREFVEREARFRSRPR